MNFLGNCSVGRKNFRTKSNMLVFHKPFHFYYIHTLLCLKLSVSPKPQKFNHKTCFKQIKLGTQNYHGININFSNNLESKEKLLKHLVFVTLFCHVSRYITWLLFLI